MNWWDMPRVINYHFRYAQVKCNMNVELTYETNLVLQFQDALKFVLQKYIHFKNATIQRVIYILGINFCLNALSRTTSLIVLTYTACI